MLFRSLDNILVTFEYDGKQLSKINIGNWFQTKCIYKGGKIDKMETRLGTLLASVNTFEYKGGKISKIIAETYPVMSIKSEEAKRVNILRFVLPQQFSEGIMKEMSQSQKGEQDATTIVTTLLTWKGNNVEKMENFEGELLISTQTFTYDDKKNPVYGALHNSLASSENNTTKETIVAHNTGWEITPKYEYVYSYTYEGNYPKTVTQTTGLYSITQHYEYLK